MKIINFVDFYFSVKILAKKKVGMRTKKKIIYFYKTKNVPIAKRMRKCVVRLSK